MPGAYARKGFFIPQENCDAGTYDDFSFDTTIFRPRTIKRCTEGLRYFFPLCSRHVQKLPEETTFSVYETISGLHCSSFVQREKTGLAFVIICWNRQLNFASFSFFNNETWAEIEWKERQDPKERTFVYIFRPEFSLPWHAGTCTYVVLYFCPFRYVLKS